MDPFVVAVLQIPVAILDDVSSTPPQRGRKSSPDFWSTSWMMKCKGDIKVVIRPGPRPTNGILIEFEIRPKFEVLWFKIYSIEHNETQKNLLTCQTFIIYFIVLFVDFTVQPSTIFAQYSVTVEETLKPTSMLHVDT